MKAEYDFNRNLRWELAAFLVEKGVAVERADDVAIVVLNRVNKDIDDVLHKIGSTPEDDGYIRW